MKKDYKGHANKGGVYQIVNQVSGKVYVGSAKTFKTRVAGHASSLKRNKHHNSHLQASWNKHGPGAFLFEVVEVIDGDKKARTAREQFFINQWKEKWEECFNFDKKLDSSDRTCWSKTQDGFSDEHKQKLSDALKEHYKNNPEARQAVSRLHKGKKRTLGHKHTEETKRKIAEAQKGRKHTKKAKALMSEAHSGKVVSEKTKQRISKAMSGRKLSEETRKKISEARKAYWLKKREDDEE